MQIKNRNLVFASQDRIVWEGKFVILAKNGKDSFGNDCYIMYMLDENNRWVRHADYGSGLAFLRDIACKNDREAEQVHKNLGNINQVAQLVKDGFVSYWVPQTIFRQSYFDESGTYIVSGIKGKV